jgi:hypothetical protein
LGIQHAHPHLHGVVFEEVYEIAGNSCDERLHDLGLPDFALLILVIGDDPLFLDDGGLLLPQLLQHLLVLFYILGIELLPALGVVLQVDEFFIGFIAVVGGDELALVVVGEALQLPILLLLCLRSLLALRHPLPCRLF